jgi:hypothetical protein
LTQKQDRDRLWELFADHRLSLVALCVLIARNAQEHADPEATLQAMDKRAPDLYRDFAHIGGRIDKLLFAEARFTAEQDDLGNEIDELSVDNNVLRSAVVALIAKEARKSTDPEAALQTIHKEIFREFDNARAAAEMDARTDHESAYLSDHIDKLLVAARLLRQ